jgi:hypothetical protein
LKLTKPIAESPIVKRMPPKKLQPSNLLLPLPEGSSGVVGVVTGLSVGVVGASVDVLVVLVVTVVGLVVVDFVEVDAVEVVATVVVVTVVVEVAAVVVVLLDDELGV